MNVPWALDFVIWKKKTQKTCQLKNYSVNVGFMLNKIIEIAGIYLFVK